MKKKLLINEDTIAFLKSENHRLETEATKQQRRIEQLLNLSEGVKTSTTAQTVRREIEKSILVRQLKQQLAHLRNLVADKDVEIENMKRDIRFARVKEVEFERDEYYAEIQRLAKTVEDVKEELHRERQRREWNSKLAGETGDDLRRELAKLASGYQHILTNISTTGKPAQRPSTAGATRSDHHAQRKVDTRSKDSSRPQSAGGMGHSGTKESSSSPGNYPAEEHDQEGDVDNAEYDGNAVENTWQGNDGNELVAASLDAGFNTEDYETTDGNSSRGTGIEPKTTFQPLGSFLPQQQAVYIQPPQVITALPSIPQHQHTPKFSAGDRIKAKFRGGETYYPGKISVVQADGLYRVVYDDNDEEGNVPESRIMPMDGDIATTSSAVSVSSHSGQNLFKSGDKVEALYYNGSTWYKGEVKGFSYLDAKKSFVYDIVYEDGDREKQVLEVNVRKLESSVATPTPVPATIIEQPKVSPRPTAQTTPPVDPVTNNPEVVVTKPVSAMAPVEPTVPSQPESTNVVVKESPRAKVEPVPTKVSTVKLEFSVGDLIEALFDKGTDWFPGKIAQVHIEGEKVLYDISYDDGDKESKVADAFIRKRPAVAASAAATTLGSSASSSSIGGVYKVGEKVEGYFEEYKAWFGGQVKAVNDNGSYHVLFDDGDEDKQILPIRLRKKAVSIRKDRYHVGDRVEARFQGDAAWFPGKISKVNTQGGVLSYNILYDDGDTEEEVVSELIRVFDQTLSQAPSAADLAIAATVPSTTNTAPSAAAAVPMKATEEPKAEVSPSKAANHRHGSITSTNLDNFLNELSDDDDGPLPPIGVVESSGDNNYGEEFEA